MLRSLGRWEEDGTDVSRILCISISTVRLNQLRRILRASHLGGQLQHREDKGTEYIVLRTYSRSSRNLVPGMTMTGLLNAGSVDDESQSKPTVGTYLLAAGDTERRHRHGDLVYAYLLFLLLLGTYLHLYVSDQHGCINSGVDWGIGRGKSAATAASQTTETVHRRRFWAVRALVAAGQIRHVGGCQVQSLREATSCDPCKRGKVTLSDTGFCGNLEATLKRRPESCRCHSVRPEEFWGAPWADGQLVTLLVVNGWPGWGSPGHRATLRLLSVGHSLFQRSVRAATVTNQGGGWPGCAHSHCPPRSLSQTSITLPTPCFSTSSSNIPTAHYRRLGTYIFVRIIRLGAILTPLARFLSLSSSSTLFLFTICVRLR